MNTDRYHTLSHTQPVLSPSDPNLLEIPEVLHRVANHTLMVIEVISLSPVNLLGWPFVNVNQKLVSEFGVGPHTLARTYCPAYPLEFKRSLDTLGFDGLSQWERY